MDRGGLCGQRNAIDLTFYRNWLSGQRKSFVDSSNVRTVGLAYGSLWDSFVGNVLGRSGRMTGWVYDDPASASRVAVPDPEAGILWRQHVAVGRSDRGDSALHATRDPAIQRYSRGRNGGAFGPNGSHHPLTPKEPRAKPTREGSGVLRGTGKWFRGSDAIH